MKTIFLSLTLSMLILDSSAQAVANIVNAVAVIITPDAVNSVAQVQETLNYTRNFLSFKVYEEERELSSNETLNLLQQIEPDLKRRYSVGNIIRPTSLVIAAGGVYLVYDALKGTDKLGVVKGETYPYVSRSLPKTLSGIGLFLIGGCLFEYGNDLKENAIGKYNVKVKASGNISQFRLGITPNGNFGAYLSLK